MELRCKEVININDGCRLGYVCDIELDLPEGNICTLIVPGPCRFFGLFGREPDFLIPMGCITKIGQDIISFSSTFYGSYGDPANTAIVKVWLPDTVLTIQGNTFRNCANLEQIYPLIPPNLVTIADYGYQACPKLTGTLTLGPNGYLGVTNLQERTFGPIACDGGGDWRQLVWR